MKMKTFALPIKKTYPQEKFVNCKSSTNKKKLRPIIIVIIFLK